MTLNDIDQIDVFIVVNGEGHRFYLSEAQTNAVFEYLKIITQDDKVINASKEVYYKVKE